MTSQQASVPTYAVTAATGHLGHLAVVELLAREVPAPDIVAVVRDHGKASELTTAGVQVREADYSDRQALAAALAGEHQETERALRACGIPFTLLRNGWYTENYTDQLGQYLRDQEIIGAASAAEPWPGKVPQVGTVDPADVRRSLRCLPDTRVLQTAAGSVFGRLGAGQRWPAS